MGCLGQDNPTPHSDHHHHDNHHSHGKTSILHDLELCNALFVVHTNAEHLHQVSHEGGGGGREGTVETVIEEFKRRSNQPLCRTMGTCDTGGGQTEHPGGGLEGEGESQPLCRTMGTRRCRRWANRASRGWSRGGGGESAVVQDYGDTAMQEVGKQSIQGVV